MWHGLVWHKKNISRHSFIFWLAIKEKLLTKDKLLRFGLIRRATCVLCETEDENVDHLFFHSSFNKYGWSAMLGDIHMNYDELPWSDYIEKNAKDLERNNFKTLLWKLSLGASVYALWRQRNNRCFSYQKTTKDSVVKNIKRLARDKGAELSGTCLNSENARVASK